MRIIVTADAVHITEANVFTALSAEFDGIDAAQAAVILGDQGLGEMPDAGHVWFDIGSLRELARPDGASPEWDESWASMIAYARGKGWVEEKSGRDAVRVHVA